MTRDENGALVVAVWNLVSPDRPPRAPELTKTITMRIKNLKVARRAYISRADGEHGDPRPLYEKMGSPVYPTQEQLKKLRETSVPTPPEVKELKNGEFSLTLPANGLAVISIR